MIQARQAETGFDGLQQREAVVVVAALDSGPTVIGLNREHHLVLILGREQALLGIRSTAVVVLIRR